MVWQGARTTDVLFASVPILVRWCGARSVDKRLLVLFTIKLLHFIGANMPRKASMPCGYEEQRRRMRASADA
jgi:hypothetical protein